MEDLAWLGFEADTGPIRQSDDSAAYDAALERIARSARVYACDCSRKNLAARMAVTSDGERPYPGRCRHRGLPIEGRYGLRVEMTEGAESFVDGLVGLRIQEPSRQCGDLLVRDRDGFWTYQFAVAVDDTRQRIDLVIRGADLLGSTGRQIRLARMLGRADPPVFVHHPLLMKPSGEKLSKSSGDSGIRELRAGGVSPEEVIGRAAVACGLIERAECIAARDVARLFTR